MEAGYDNTSAVGAGFGDVEKLREAVSNGPCGLTGWRLSVKHSVETLLAVIVLPFLVLVYVLAGIAIKLESKGPVLFKQARIGKDGKPFQMYKFRSMYDGAEISRSKFESLNESTGPTFKIRRDPRVTRVGAVLRHTSMDELPQILNVIKGDMSIVGPRPALPGEVEHYNVHQCGRLAVRPGLTCLWQVRGRSNVSFDEWIELDLEYIRNQSLWLDFTIIMKTIPAVFSGSGAW